LGRFELERGYCFPTDRPLETFELLQIGHWPGVTEGADRRRPNPVRGLTGGEGRVRGNVQGLTRSRGWPVSGKRGAEAA
jgi:hypothetical protein